MIDQDLLRRRGLRERWAARIFDYGRLAGVTCELVTARGTRVMAHSMKFAPADPDFGICEALQMVADRLNDRLMASTA